MKNLFNFKTVSFFGLMALIALFACNKNKRLDVDQPKPKTVADQSLIDGLERNGVDLQIKDGKSLDQHNWETLKMIRLVQQQFEKEHPNEFLRAEYSLVEGRLMVHLCKLSDAENKQVVQDKNNKRKRSACKGNAEEVLACVKKAIDDCFAEGHQPAIQCFDCPVVCNGNGVASPKN